MIIRVADYAPSPGGRYVVDGPYSGEWFREEILIPAVHTALKRGEHLTVLLDGTSGYGSSFLEEAFGGLVRSRLVQPKDISDVLTVKAESRLFAPYQALAERYLLAAQRQVAA